MVTHRGLKARLRRALEQAQRAAQRGDLAVYDEWVAEAKRIEKEMSND